MKFLNILLGVSLTALGYYLGIKVYKKTNSQVLSPLVSGSLIVLAIMSVFKIDMESYNEGAKMISFLIGPATVVLAVPLYKNIELVKKRWQSILVGITVGLMAGFVTIYVLSRAFGINYEVMASMMPKSVTTAISIAISEKVGGVMGLTVTFTILTAIVGSLVSGFIIEKLKIEDPIARGIGIGTSAHAMGTAKAMELGEKEGAFASVAITLAGVLSVFLVPLVLKIFTI